MSAAATRFRRYRSGPRIAVVAAPFEAAVGPLGILEPGGLDRLLAGGAAGTGRALNAAVPLPDRDDRLHLRPFRHGGWLAPMTGGRLPSLDRPPAELRATAALHAAGAPVPRPVLVAGLRRGPASWTAVVGTVHVEDASDGIAFLAQCPAPPRLLAAAAAAGAGIRRFHDAGGRHADLHAGNLLVRESPSDPEVVLVDLDRAGFGPPPSPSRRMAEIMRLYRSLVKRRLRAAQTPEIAARFLDAYVGGSAELRESLCARLPRERLRLALHRIAYRREGANSP